MASISAPNAEIIIAMEELGLAGWLPGYRGRTRPRRDPANRALSAAAPTASATQPERANAQHIVPAIGVALAAAGALTLATVVESAGVGERGSAAARGVVRAALLGVGAFALAFAFRAFGRR